MGCLRLRHGAGCARWLGVLTSTAAAYRKAGGQRVPVSFLRAGYCRMADVAQGASAGAGAVKASDGGTTARATAMTTGVSDASTQRRTAEPTKATGAAVGAATSAPVPAADLLAKRLRMVSCRPVQHAPRCFPLRIRSQERAVRPLSVCSTSARQAHAFACAD